MQVEILENTFEPGNMPAPTILKAGSIVELDDGAAKSLIEKGVAAEFKSTKKKEEAPAEEEKTVPAKK